MIALRTSPTFQELLRRTIGNPAILKLGFDMTQVRCGVGRTYRPGS